MRKTIIFGALAALLGLAAVAQASDDDGRFMPGAGLVVQERMTDGRDSNHDRYEQREHARDMRGDHGNGDNDRYEDRERHRGGRD